STQRARGGVRCRDSGYQGKFPSAEISVAMSRLLVSSACFLIRSGPLAAQSPQVLTKVDFATDIQPILRQHCVECHGPDKQRAGMRLDRKSSALKSFSRRIVPGSSENSMLYHRLIGEFGQPMPPDGGLKPQQTAAVKIWIDRGAECADALANAVGAAGAGEDAAAAGARSRGECEVRRYADGADGCSAPSGRRTGGEAAAGPRSEPEFECEAGAGGRAAAGRDYGERRGDDKTAAG